MITGFCMTIISKFVLQSMETIGPYFTALETMPPSFLSALLVGYVVTILWPDDALEAAYRGDLTSIDTEIEKPSESQRAAKI
tara:strand:+ start:152 stop:397 length:246 start_codon:yes stop_codon:yes gene_type:complete